MDKLETSVTRKISYTLTALAYGFRDYSLHLIAISAMVGIGSIILFWLPESPRWLIARFVDNV